MSQRLSPVAGMTPDLQRRIAEQQEKEATLAAAKLRKKRDEDFKAFAQVIDDCRENKNRRKLVVTMERVLADEDNELCPESPLIIKAKLLIEDLTAHFMLVEELQQRQKAVDKLSRREKGEINRAFQAFEQADKGTVLAVALRPVFEALGINVRNSEIRRLLVTVQKDGLSELSLSELTLLVAPLVKQRDPRSTIMHRYKAFNENPVVDSNGKMLKPGISFRNLAKLSGEVGRNDTPEFLQSLIEIADMDGDEKINAKEFWVYMKNHADLERIRTQEKQKSIRIAKEKRIANARRDLQTALKVAHKDLDPLKLRTALMEALNKGLPSDIELVKDTKHFVHDLDELSKYEQ